MWTQVETLYESAKTKYRLKLLGGFSGLSNSASWVYLAEDIQNVSFLKGGEFIITTGLFTQNGIGLLKFIQTLTVNNCSGILINVGQYLQEQDVTDEIIKYCNSNRIPLLTMPWEIHLVDIMRDYCSLLLQDNYNESTLTSAFQNAVSQLPVPENILRILHTFDFTTAGEYRVFVLRNLIDSTRLTSPLNSTGMKYHLFSYENHYVLVCRLDGSTLRLEELVELICFCDSVAAGASDVLHSLQSLSQAYKCARFSLAAAELWQRQFILFEDLGLFQLLFHVADEKLLNTMRERQLGRLEDYDFKHNTEYTDTLRTYLLSDCNLVETSLRLHTHRNTIIYRIKKIKELLETDLDNSSIKFDLMMAFQIKEYLAL